MTRHSFNANKTWHSFITKKTWHSFCCKGNNLKNISLHWNSSQRVCEVEFKDNQRMVELTPMTWGTSSYGKPPSCTNSLRSILDLFAAAFGHKRMPSFTHLKPQFNILSQKYLFQSTKNSKRCKACVAICLIFSTQPQKHHCNMNWMNTH